MYVEASSILAGTDICTGLWTSGDVHALYSVPGYWICHLCRMQECFAVYCECLDQNPTVIAKCTGWGHLREYWVSHSHPWNVVYVDKPVPLALASRSKSS